MLEIAWRHGAVILGSLMLCCVAPSAASQAPSPGRTSSPTASPNPTAASTLTASSARSADADDDATTTLADSILAPANATTGHSLSFIVRPLVNKLRISSISVTDLSRTINGVTRSIDTSRVGLATTGQCETTPSLIAQGQKCLVTVTLRDPKLYAPGRYGVDVLLTSDERTRTVQLLFEHRRPIIVAILLVLLGLGLGFGVGVWLNGGRERAAYRLAIRTVQDKLLELRSRFDELSGDAEKIVLRGDEMAASEKAPDTTELNELEQRPSQLLFLAHAKRDPGRIGATKESIAVLDGAIKAMGAAMLPNPEGHLTAVPEELVKAVQAAQKSLASTARIEAAVVVSPPDRLSSRTTGNLIAERRRFALRESLVSVVLALIFAAMALVAFYAEAPIWGSSADMLGIFLVGFGAYAGSAASVTAFLGRARTAWP